MLPTTCQCSPVFCSASRGLSGKPTFCNRVPKITDTPVGTFLSFSLSHWYSSNQSLAVSMLLVALHAMRHSQLYCLLSHLCQEQELFPGPEGSVTAPSCSLSCLVPCGLGFCYWSSTVLRVYSGADDCGSFFKGCAFFPNFKTPFC